VADTPVSPKLELAHFVSLDGSPKVDVKVHFNPASLQYTIQNTLKEEGQGAKKKQHVSQTSAKLTMDLVFDTTDTGADVRTITDQIAKLLEPVGKSKAPRRVEFGWGAYSFRGLVEQYKETLDFFSPGGVPLRSSINLTLASQEVAFESKHNPPASVDSDLTPEPVVVPTPAIGGAFSAASIANALGAPRAARAIAAANGSASLRFGASAGASIGGGISVGAGAGVGASAGASAGVTAGAGISVSGGATLLPAAAFSAGASAGAGIGAGAGLGISAGAGGGIGIGGGAGFGIGAGAAAGVSVSAGAVHSAACAQAARRAFRFPIHGRSSKRAAALRSAPVCSSDLGAARCPRLPVPASVRMSALTPICPHASNSTRQGYAHARRIRSHRYRDRSGAESGAKAGRISQSAGQREARRARASGADEAGIAPKTTLRGLTSR
jgi:hypothetical protein